MRQRLKIGRRRLASHPNTPDGRRLESWKEIAAYLKREVRTAMRWEKERGLPVHRIPGKRSGVYALSSEVEAWLRAESASNGDRLAEAPPSAPPGKSGKPALWAILVATTFMLGIAAVHRVHGRDSRKERYFKDSHYPSAQGLRKRRRSQTQ